MVIAPFASAEVVARVKVVLSRRSPGLASNPPSTIVFSGWSLDVPGRRRPIPKAVVDLTPAEFSLLEVLVRRAGRVQSREKLLDAVAGREAGPFDRAIDNLISRLRRKIEEDPRSPRLIVTVTGFGYKFDLEVGRSALRSASALRRVPSARAVVVLPFHAMDARNENFAACLAEDLVAELAPRCDTPVVAAGMAAGGAARVLGAGPVSRELGGRYAVAGSVRRERSGLRIAVRLMEAESGTHLWANALHVECDRSGTNIQSALFAIVNSLKAQITIAEGVRAEVAGGADAAALVARGRAILARAFAPDSTRIARRFFERAVTLDGGCAEAILSLGTD